MLSDQPATAAHLAEPFRQGYEPNVRWGWQCLTCDTEEYVPTMAEAEAAAKAHTEPTTAASRHHRQMTDDLFTPEPPVTCLICGSHDGTVTITKNDDGSTTWVGHCNKCGSHEEKTVPLARCVPLCAAGDKAPWWQHEALCPVRRAHRDGD